MCGGGIDTLTHRYEDTRIFLFTTMSKMVPFKVRNKICFFVQVPSCVIQYPCRFICWLRGVTQTAVPILPTLCTWHRLQKAAYSEGIVRWVCNITSSSGIAIWAGFIGFCIWYKTFTELCSVVISISASYLWGLGIESWLKDRLFRMRFLLLWFSSIPSGKWCFQNL